MRLRFAILALASVATAMPAVDAAEPEGVQDERPSILLAIADDWSWPHAGAYGEAAVKTPAFDRLAAQGALFRNAYVSSPSCTPSRGALLTGQWHWRLGGAANLWSVFPDRFRTYPEILEAAGYAVGHTGKAWGPGRAATPGRALAGRAYRSFQAFLEQRPAGKPFCFWLGSADPHRPYPRDSGAKAGIPLDAIRVPACLPDHPTVRGDLADYLLEVQRFDALVGAAIASLEERGELDRTLAVVTSDNGLPFPRSKSNLYDTGTRVPLAVRWPARVGAGRTVDDMVSLTDLAPTFLEAAGLAPPGDMTGGSLLPILAAAGSGRIDLARDAVLFGKERHVAGQEAPDPGGYPCRAIRTQDFLYIRNFRPDRWPAGTPRHERATIPGAWYADCDNGPSKTHVIASRDLDEACRRLYELAFAKRPSEELYDLRVDPDQLANVADEPRYSDAKDRLYRRLMQALISTGDPRLLGGADLLEAHPYLGGAPKWPGGE